MRRPCGPGQRGYLRQIVIPFGTVPEWADVLIAVTLAAVLFVAVIAVHRVLVKR